MEPRAKEWMLATARGDYHAIARLLREEPRLARRRVRKKSLFLSFLFGGGKLIVFDVFCPMSYFVFVSYSPSLRKRTGPFFLCRHSSNFFQGTWWDGDAPTSFFPIFWVCLFVCWWNCGLPQIVESFVLTRATPPALICGDDDDEWCRRHVKRKRNTKLTAFRSISVRPEERISLHLKRLTLCTKWEIHLLLLDWNVFTSFFSWKKRFLVSFRIPFDTIWHFGPGGATHSSPKQLENGDSNLTTLFKNNFLLIFISMAPRRSAQQMERRHAETR